MAAKNLDVNQGFRDDCSRLIARFEQLETVRFDGFCEIWQDMKFSLVFAGRSSLIELLEFCEDCLLVAKEFFLPPMTFKERIGGLYLLYGLYFKMPIQGPKIRVKLDEWQHIVELRAEIGQAEHHDASFVLAKLMSACAFTHSFLEQELGLEKNYRLKAGRAVNHYSLLPEIRELAVPQDLFDRINVLSKEYESAKSSETSQPSTSRRARTDSPEGLRLYDANFGEKLLSSVKELENARKAIREIRPSNRSSTKRGQNPDIEEKKAEQTRKGKGARDAIRCMTGHGFDTDSSPSEEETPEIPFIKCGPLPDFFDDSSGGE